MWFFIWLLTTLLQLFEVNLLGGKLLTLCADERQLF